MRRRTAPKPTICKRQTPAPADTGADLGLSVQGRIRALILILHGENVVLDRDLAELHGVGTRALLRAERRNRARFPDDFAFHLTSDEYRDLRSQVVISSWGGRKPHGVSSVARRASARERPRGCPLGLEGGKLE